MALNIKPLSDRVLIEPVAAETKTASGIFIPDTAKEKPQKGRVIATGKGRYLGGKKVPLEVAVGDVVLFKKYGPDEIKIDGKEYYILEEEDILAIIS